MKLNLKQQMILLQVKGHSRKEMWDYLIKLTQLGLASASLALDDLRHLTGNLDLAFDLDWDLDPDLLLEVNRLTRQAIFMGDPDYPDLWLKIKQPPILIYFQGRRDLLTQPLISIVGTRNNSQYGYEMTQAITRAILSKGWVVVSGLAKGIDAIVHQTALEMGQDKTIAIIATGTQEYYPRDHIDLQDQIGQKHLVLSEYLPQAKAQRHHFIMRNRLVAGISPVTIVVEAAMQSGSLITANYALQYDRELLVLPGPINVSQSAGCNDLIDKGAQPILSMQQMLELIEELFSNQAYI